MGKHEVYRAHLKSILNDLEISEGEFLDAM